MQQWWWILSTEEQLNGFDLKCRTDGKQSNEAIHRNPSSPEVDGFEFCAFVNKNKKASLRHMAATPHTDCLRNKHVKKESGFESFFFLMISDRLGKRLGYCCYLKMMAAFCNCEKRLIGDECSSYVEVLQGTSCWYLPKKQKGNLLDILQWILKILQFTLHNITSWTTPESVMAVMPHKEIELKLATHLAEAIW